MKFSKYKITICTAKVKGLWREYSAEKKVESRKFWNARTPEIENKGFKNKAIFDFR